MLTAHGLDLYFGVSRDRERKKSRNLRDPCPIFRNSPSLPELLPKSVTRKCSFYASLEPNEEVLVGIAPWLNSAGLEMTLRGGQKYRGGKCL